MTRVSRRMIVKGLAALPLAAALPGGVSAAPLDTVAKKGRLRVAVYRDFAPWSWQRDGRLVGVDVDLGTALAEALGVKPEFMELGADENVDDDLRNAVWKGPITGGQVADVMMHVPVDKEFALRNDMAVITGAYHKELFAIACDPERVACDGSPAELAGEPIAVEIDSVPDFYLTGSFGGRLRGDVNHYADGVKAVEALRRGEAASAMATVTQLDFALGEDRKRFKVNRGPLPGLFRPGWEIGLAVKADSRDLAYKLDDLMGEMIRSGRVGEIFAKYGMTHVPPNMG